MTARLTRDTIAGDKGGRSGIPPFGGVSGWNYYHCRRCDTSGDISSPESGPENSAPLLPSLDDFPTLREILGLLDRESSPEEVDDDDNGLEHLFGYPQTWKAHLVVLDPHLPPQSLCLPGHKRQPFLDRLYNGER
jgi:hypothetical protein